jgi:uncharacterized membrane protein YdbT with pleckstrin-like domain
VSYPSRLLNDHETVSVDLHPHWWFLVVPSLALVASIAAGIVTLALTDHGSNVRTVAAWASIGAIVACVGWLSVRYGRWVSTHFVITDQRVIYRAGLFTKYGIEIPLERVQTVHFRQGIFERLVGAGDLLIESGAESGQQRFTDIRQPDRVQRVLHAQMAARASLGGGRGAGGGLVDVAGQLERLEQMRDRGTLTHDEFERHKRRLLEP